jgi:hypothetical protein
MDPPGSMPCVQFRAGPRGARGDVLSTAARTKQLYLQNTFFFVYQIISSKYEFGLDWKDVWFSLV